MNTQTIKTKLVAFLGNKVTAYIQAIRFVCLLKTKRSVDPEFQLLHKLLRKGDTAIDVGANGANWTYCLHRHIGDEGSLFAFEADPYYALATELAVKLMRLKGIHFFRFGLSCKNEEVFLRIADSDGQLYSGLGYVDKEAERNDENVISVHLKTLDSLLKDYPRLLKTKLIKCDVEGYELYVFQGAIQILRTARPFVILEVGHFEKHGYSVKELYDFFMEKQYSCFAMVDDNMLSETDSSMNHEKAISDNRVLIPEEQINILQTIIV